MSAAARPPHPVLASAVCVVGGAALSAAFPPAAVYPVAFVGLIPLLWVLRRVGAAAAAGYGLLFGIAFFGSTLYWIFRFGVLAWTSLTLLSAGFVAVFGVLAVAVTRRHRPLVTAIGLAGAWTVVEFVRGAWPLGGFTWGTLGVSQVDDRVLLPLAAITGVWGLSFVVVAVNALLLEVATRLRERRGVGLGAAVAPAGVAAALVIAPVVVAFPTAEGPSVDVATVQVDVRTAAELPSADEDLAIARTHVDLHRSLSADPPDLVVWGEGALDPGAARDTSTATAVREAIADVGVPALVGAVSDDADGRQRTAVFGFDADGDLRDRYDKVHLVPFGEYVPFRARLGWVQAIEQIPVDRAAGERAAVMTLPGLPAIAAPICFENSFPALTRAFVDEGAAFLVVPVNNASYGFTAASEQHLQMSRMRAVENGRWVVNAAISGVSAFVDPSGAVVSRTELFETDILRGRIRTSDARTPYTRLGDWFPWLSAVLVVGAMSIPKRQVTDAIALEPLPERPRTLVILPTYDERATIQQVIDGVLDRSDDVSILVVDDSSPDGTAQAVRAVADRDARVRLLERPARSGLASAYLRGFEIALDEGYDLVVEMDSDLSHDPTELGALLAAAPGAGLVIGSRYVPGGSVTNWSRVRLGLSRAGNLYARLMLGLPIHDATSGYRVYRRGVLRTLLATPVVSDGYGFQVELALRAWRLGYRVVEVPITFREREHGASKISRRIVVEALWLITKWGIAARLRPESASEDTVPAR
ncbi:MAG TPA: apolipoprotein N-acyltransferase [Actinomycetota bacterium]|nr:apolipoprotein N-acyltransferase [Actinomycetota bacterium]